MRRFAVSLISFALVLLAFAAILPAESRQLVIFKSHDYISRNYEVQHFVDTLTLEAGQLEVPLTMTINNGSPEVPAFKWFRIMINGQIVASEADMHGKEIACKDVSGLLQGANSQVQIEAGGVPGANLWWTISAEQMELTGVEPREAMPGQELKITGSNIPASPDLLSVAVDGKPAKIISASVDSIVIQLSESQSQGVKEIQARTARQITNRISVTIVSRPVPEILGIDCWMAPPGGTINISGRNFSQNAAENKVFFNTVAAQVQSSSATQLAVIVPNWQWAPSQLNIPLSVVVNGMRSNTFPFDIGPMYHGGMPSFGHD